MNVPGSDAELNQALEKAGRVADFLELGELMCLDALHREESCGGHFREEHQTEDGEALRDDEHFAYVAAWEYTGDRTRAARCTRSRWRSRTCTWRSGATSRRRSASEREPHAPRLAPGRTRRRGPLGRSTRRRDLSPDMSFLEMLDVVNERLMRGARARSRSTTTAARASAARAA